MEVSGVRPSAAFGLELLGRFWNCLEGSGNHLIGRRFEVLKMNKTHFYLKLYYYYQNIKYNNQSKLIYGPTQPGPMYSEYK